MATPRIIVDNVYDGIPLALPSAQSFRPVTRWQSRFKAKDAEAKVVVLGLNKIKDKYNLRKYRQSENRKYNCTCVLRNIFTFNLVCIFEGFFKCIGTRHIKTSASRD